MDELIYFDANAVYGPRPGKAAEARWTLQHLLEDYELAGIAGGLVTHTLALNDDPMAGNRRLISEIAPYRDRLFPCWVALPSTSGEFPIVERFMEELDRNDVRAVRIEPRHYRIPMRERIWGELRDAIVGRRLLVLISADYAARDFDLEDQLLRLLNDTPVLMTGHGWHQWRQVMDLMETYPHLHIEFSAFQAHYAVEYFAERFGVERCLFGTGAMEKSPGAARGFCDWSLLTRSEAARIAGDNLRGLLGGAGPASSPAPETWHDDITAAARLGLPLPYDVLDAHCHILADGSHTGGAHHVMLNGDAAGMLRIRERVGINRTAVMSWSGPLNMDTEVGNQVILDAVRRYPDHYVGVLTSNPTHQAADEIARDIERYHVALGFPGMKTLAPREGIRYHDSSLSAWYQFGNEHHLYAIVDTAGHMDEEAVSELAQRYPHLGIHLDHCGRSWAFAKWAISLMRQYPNIWAQINFTSVTNGVIEYLVEQAGANRVLFGTDSPMRDPRPQAAWVVFSRLTSYEKRRVLGENFDAILKDTRLPVRRAP